ncbi:MAG: hypothetical protein IJB97_08365, partial [Clostridia bacterium]|nr:hypothetical protein [Clostridia bacterium]
MAEKNVYENLLKIMEPKKAGDHDWFLALLDAQKQKEYEDERIAAVMQMLRIVRIRPCKAKIAAAQAEMKRLETSPDRAASDYQKVLWLLDEIEAYKRKIDGYRPFFDEPYFARMDLIDQIEGYNSYYIGKKGDERLEIVDWR